MFMKLYELVDAMKRAPVPYCPKVELRKGLEHYCDANINSQVLKVYSGCEIDYVAPKYRDHIVIALKED